MQDTITSTKSCRYCQQSFSITQNDQTMYDTFAVKIGSTSFPLPHPTLCPSCRAMRRLSFRNERNLYKRKCDKTGKDIISVYAPSSSLIKEGDPKGGGFTVYDQKLWRSDDRNPLDYGFVFDFSKSFTEQFDVLMKSVPLCSIYNINSENSDYTNICAFNKNCYMIVESSNNENCYHGYWLQKSNNCVDCSMVNFSECCYASVDLERCFKLFHSQYCRECSNSWYLVDCTNCESCFGCIQQEGKKYMIFDKQVTKEEYEIFVDIFKKASYVKKQELLESFYDACKKVGKLLHIRNSSEVEGDYIYEAEQVFQSYEIHDAKNVRYSKHVWFNSGDCMDVDTVGYNSFLMYECINTALDAYNNKFCMRCWSGCKNLLYCFNCDNCSDCFGCIGIRNKSYCVFNKQYSKEEYQEIVSNIITHLVETKEWGEFFGSIFESFWL